jgi:hypothetical protein
MGARGLHRARKGLAANHEIISQPRKTRRATANPAYTDSELSIFSTSTSLKIQPEWNAERTGCDRISSELSPGSGPLQNQLASPLVSGSSSTLSSSTVN